MSEPLPSDSTAPPRLEWRIDVPLLTQPLLLLVYAKATVLVVLIMGVLLTFLVLVGDGKADSIGAMWLLTGISTLVVVGLGLVAAALLLRNRLAMRYVIDDRGVEQSMVDRRATVASGAAVVLGALSGSPGTIGAGLIARSQSRTAVNWSSLVSARFHPRHDAIALRNAWRTVILLFCTPQNYAEVAARIEKELATRRGSSRARRSPIPGLLLRTVLTVAACLPFFVLPYPFRLDLFVPLFTLGFALSALWLVPHFAWVMIGGLGWMWVQIYLSATLERHSTLDDTVFRSWQRMSLEDWSPIILCGIATTYLLWQAYSALRGRIPSALGGDDDPATGGER